MGERADHNDRAPGGAGASLEQTAAGYRTDPQQGGGARALVEEELPTYSAPDPPRRDDLLAPVLLGLGRNGSAPEPTHRSDEFSVELVEASSADAADSAPQRVRGKLPSLVFAGDVIAERYQVVDILGEGGMGIVYLCLDRASGEHVAVKRVVLPEGPMAAEYLMWFYKEARALAALSHPSIVSARDFGQLRDGSPYLAMDFASGVSLHDLSYARLSFPLIWSIVDQILGALAHAHARGVVHGDLKPSNVLVEQIEGHPPQIHILDFGLAWMMQDYHDERLDGSKALEVSPHAGAGTPGFMAPEQIQHEMHHVCGATDLYALGCVLYKLLTGNAPFSGEAKELLKLHAFEKPSLPRLALRAPAETAGFVMRLLARRPWERWEYAADARAQWGKWRPSADIDAAEYRFPVLPSAARRSALPRPSQTAAASARELSVARDRPAGLLRMRPSPFVGREEIRRQLRDICDEAIDNDGPPHRLVLLVGPAGVGKSRIAEWLCEVVHEEGTMVPLRARYRNIRGPLEGVLGAVSHHYNFERCDRNTIEQSLLLRWSIPKDDKHGRTWVAGAAEWLRPTPPGSDMPLGPSGIRFALDSLDTRRLVIRYTLRRIARGRPLLLWLDDLHHAAESTFEGLIKIHQGEPDQRLVIVTTVRSEDVQKHTAAVDQLRRLREALDGTVIQVSAMSPETTSALLRNSLPLDQAAVSEAVKRSRGNPLFALQQLHAWALQGDLEFSDGVYRVPEAVLAVRPATTAELWDSRVAALPEDQRIAGYAVATLGSDVRRQVLARLLRSLEIDADRAIVALQDSEIILPLGPGRYCFPHALLHEHLLDRLSQRFDARSVYVAAADALTVHPLASTRSVVRQRVRNLLEAGESDRAADLLFHFLQQAWNGAREPLATLADLRLLHGHLSGRSLALRHRWQAEALRHVGRVEEATTHAETALAAFEKMGDKESQAHCLRLLGHLASERGSSAEGLRLVERAYRIFRQLGLILGQAQCEAVSGEIEYLLGNNEQAREYTQNGEAHFARLSQPLGRGQCLLLLSWIDHSEGAVERSRRLAIQARSQFERAGYRLGIAQSDASLAHVEHRLMNYYSAERGAQDALRAFESLRTPRGQAACERLLAMIGIDTDDGDSAEIHAERAEKIYEEMGDPWGVLEAKLLQCQVALGRHDTVRARALLRDCAEIRVEEAEPRQHYLLTEAWLELLEGKSERAYEALEAAADVFGQRARIGDHTAHLLARLSRLAWPPHVIERIEAWMALLSDRTRREQD
jgi:serine/threonine protein kinase/tetratricopeptide (TPR) repeat protein